MAPAPAPAPSPVPQKTGQKWRHSKGSSRLMDWTSAQELAMAKALKAIKKFITGSSGLSLMEKAATGKVKISREKVPSTSTGVSGAGKAPKALDLFGSGSSSSDDEAAASAPHQKCLWKSPPRKNIQKSSDAPTAGGMPAWSFALPSSYYCRI
jgi:hypothetical protein